MFAGLKPYKEYKESGSPWLATVPVHWEVRNLRTLIRPRAERNRADLPLLSVAREKGVFVRSSSDVDENHNVVPEDLSNYKVARAGDLVINKMKAWQGSMGIAPCDGIVSPAYFVFDFGIGNSAFGQYLLRSKPYVAHFGQASDGVRIGQWDLTVAGMRQIPVLVPPLEEQAAIARFLDYADRRIRRYVGVKQKLVKLLEEQKQAIIHGAVTRGLDPNVRLKPSGEAWLGSVPLHWSVASLRFRYAQCLGKMVDAKQVTGKHLIPYLRNVDVRWDRINTIDLPLIDIAPHEIERFTVRVGDLLVCEGRHLGRCAFWSGEVETCAFQKALHRLRPLNADTDDPRFLFFCMCLAYARDAFNMNKVDNTIPHLTGEMLRAHRFAFPPIEEQRAIKAYLDSATEGIESTAVVAKMEVALLREYRSRLIADVVTGKLDVRAAAASLPEELDELEPLAEGDALEDGDEGTVDADLDATSEDAEV